MAYTLSKSKVGASGLWRLLPFARFSSIIFHGSVLVVAALLFANTSTAFGGRDDINAPMYEMRALWVASVVNIDWPSRQGLTPQQQQQEYIDMMDFAADNNFNAVFVQVRPTGDSMYASNYLPWSHWLSGSQKYPGYDALPFLVEEAHKRGLEFHAWINPYRIAFNDAQWSMMSPAHIAKRNPDWVVKYGGKYYFDPGNRDASKYVVDATLELVRNYDIDAIHMDDYFYPYAAGGEEFDDSKSFATYAKTGTNKGDWRRRNVNNFVAELSRGIKGTKPYVKFGISPFGVWRNKDMDSTGSDTQAGQTNYDDLYADTRFWLQKKYVDYMVPQIYWEFGHPKADYKTISDWWSKEIGKARGRTHLYIGHGAYRLLSGAGQRWSASGELTRQIYYSRNDKSIKGAAFFSISSLTQQPEIFKAEFKRNNYPYKALVPPMPWLKVARPSKADRVEVSNYAESVGGNASGAGVIGGVRQGQKIVVTDFGNNSNKYYVLYKAPSGKRPRKNPKNILAILYRTGNTTEFVHWTLDDYAYFVQPMNRNNVLGKFQEADRVLPF